MPHHDVKDANRSNAKSMRSGMTDAELKLWNELRARRLMNLKFRRQLPIGPYIVDFACPEHKLIIELDGSQHARPDNIAHDHTRAAYLQGGGWTVRRFWNDEVLNNITAVCDSIVNDLQSQGVEFS